MSIVILTNVSVTKSKQPLTPVVSDLPLYYH